ncbi:MAG TPA: hypothetical protein VGO31_10430 [Microbacteriaceae bacterium]|jgi:hypothetical protein|nr:hypothetical protein [Microbacteriaceae bacterium]
MKRNFSRGVILACAALIAAGIALYGTVGAGAGQRPSAAHDFATGQSLAGQAYFANGRLEYPQDIASQIDTLNLALDSCYTSHGATKVVLPDGSWTYSDPGSVAQPACAGAQDAVNAFANGPKMAGFSAGIAALTHSFWACMIGRGVVPGIDSDAKVDTSSDAFKSGAKSCSTAANAKAGVKSP